MKENELKMSNMLLGTKKEKSCGLNPDRLGLSVMAERTV
jgi:hypothetical protein